MESKKKKKYIITDFGASNGRVSIGTYCGNKFEIETLHRFENSQVLLNGRYFWDILKLFSELKKGISAVFNKYGNIRSVAVKFIKDYEAMANILLEHENEIDENLKNHNYVDNMLMIRELIFGKIK